MSDNIDYEKFYNDVDDLFYRNKFNKRNKKLLDAIEDLFSDYNRIESELDDTKDELQDLKSEIHELKEEFSTLEIDYDNLCSGNEELKKKVDEYRNILISNNLGEYLI